MRCEIPSMMKFRIRGSTYYANEPIIVEIDAESEDEARVQAHGKLIHPHAIEIVTGAPESKSRAGVVYLLRCGKNHKIGKSTNPESRYGQLKIQLLEKPELVHEIQTNNVDYVERHWHRRFQTLRANGEWFLLSDGDVAEFVSCKRIEAG
jgi:hypothetical protein